MLNVTVQQAQWDKFSRTGHQNNADGSSLSSVFFLAWRPGQIPYAFRGSVSLSAKQKRRFSRTSLSTQNYDLSTYLGLESFWVQMSFVNSQIFPF